jgi:hypothetical protein
MPARKTLELILIFASFCLLIGSGCGQVAEEQSSDTWSVSALPVSVRLDPSSGKIIEDRPDLYRMEPLGDLLAGNWVYDGTGVSLTAARGEYVSFQLVIEKKTPGSLKDIIIDMSPFASGNAQIKIKPELFLQWAVEVKTHSSGYEKSSLGPGWYPDALIPLRLIQQDVANTGRLHYPLELPDFRNRIDNQRFLLIWVDQYVPGERTNAAPGDYSSEVTVKIGDTVKKLPVRLKVRDFALPNGNRLAGNCQHEGFLRRMDERLELAVYQLFKRHRVVPADPTYDPAIRVSAGGKVSIDFEIYDKRLKKYFTGEAFTEKYGYTDGPGYGEPIEQFVLPFDVYSKHDIPGWPPVVFNDLSPSEDLMDRYRQAALLEQEPARQAVYLEAIRRVRQHILSMVDPEKTDLVVYLNGLDESYFPEAWARMDFWGAIFKEHFPEVNFRVDGSYSEEAMEVIHDAIDYWCCHTIGYNIGTIEAYRKLGVVDWLYGPQLYEQEKNGWCGSSTFMDLELTNERLISWACWKYGTHTWCSWGIGSSWETGWYNSETWKDSFRDHGTGPLSYRCYNGNALEIYAPGMLPGVNVPCPTVRLKAKRDGVEEYEYMRLLSKLDGNSKRVDELVNRIVYSPYGEASIGNLEAWNHNPEQWDKVRLELGEMIERKMKK